MAEGSVDGEWKVLSKMSLVIFGVFKRVEDALGIVEGVYVVVHVHGRDNI